MDLPRLAIAALGGTVSMQGSTVQSSCGSIGGEMDLARFLKFQD